MPHAHTLHINKFEEHLAELTKLKFKKRNYETTQAIKNGFLFNIDFLHSTYLVDHRNRNHLTPQGPLCTPLFMVSPKSIYPTSFYPKHQCTSLFYGLFKVYIPYTSLSYTLSIQYYYHVITTPTSSQTISPTTCNLLQEHPNHTSTTATSSYNSLNSSHSLLIKSSHIPFLLVHSEGLHTAFCIVHFILPSWEINQFNTSPKSQVIILKHPTPAISLLRFTISVQFRPSQQNLLLSTILAMFFSWPHTTSIGYTKAHAHARSVSCNVILDANIVMPYMVQIQS